MKKLDDRSRVIVFLFLVVLVSGFPELFKEDFIYPIGSIKSIGFTAGVILSALIYMRWKYSVTFFYILFIPVIAADFIILALISGDHFVNYLMLTLCHIGLLIIFRFSRSIKSYLGSGRAESKY